MKTTILLLSLVLTACTQGFEGMGYVADPTITQMPATPTECPYGGIVVTVNSGVPQSICNGAIGLPGSPGAQGPTGADLTPITFVQFCPGVTVYPAQFDEVGFCIGGNLYAVYSANNGFLTYLPPGVYNSNGIGNSCTFTVLANCRVVN